VQRRGLVPDTISVTIKPIVAAMVGKNISGAAANPSAGNSWNGSHAPDQAHVNRGPSPHVID
jgi:hypothetical protein